VGQVGARVGLPVNLLQCLRLCVPMCAGDPLEIWFNPPSERVCFGAISEGLQTSMAARTRWVRTISAGLWPVLTLSTASLVTQFASARVASRSLLTGARAQRPHLFNAQDYSRCRRSDTLQPCLHTPLLPALCRHIAGTLRAHSDKLCLCADVPISSEEV
jgi:hypothetical protein